MHDQSHPPRPALAPCHRHRLLRRRRSPPSRTPPPSDPRHARSHDDETIVVTGVRRDVDDMLGGVSVVDGAELAQRDPPEHRRDARQAARGQRDELRPRRLAPDPARARRRPHPHPDRRHRQPRSVVIERRPCRRDQPADRRPHRDLARPVGLAVRVGGDRRGGQRHRFAHPAPRPGAPGARRRPVRLWQRRQRALGQSRGRCPARRGLRAPRRRQLGEERRIAHRRLHPVEAAARGSARQRRPRDPRARRPQGRPAQQRRQVGRSRGRDRLCEGRAQRRRVGHAPHRALRRPDPLLARPRGRGRGAAARRRADAL